VAVIGLRLRLTAYVLTGGNVRARSGERRVAAGREEGVPQTATAWWVLVDDGFGAKINSSDALVRIYSVRNLGDDA
jgi:hypothetical protein